MTPFVTRAPRLRYVGPFDGFRGMAVCMVVLAHAAEEQLQGFGVLVDLFFVISGFLITTLLLDEHRERGRIDFREFYLRRALRLFPVLFSVLALTLVFGLLVGDAEFRRKVIEDVAAAGLYAYHVVFPVNYTVVGGGIPEPRPLIQAWSLSVEEHFYLFGAVLTALVVKFRRHRELLVAFGAFVVFVAVARATGHVGWRIMWYQRPDAIAVGVMVAFVNALLPEELPAATDRLLRRLGTVAALAYGSMIFVGTTLARPLGLYFPIWPEVGGSLHDGVFWGEFAHSVGAVSAGIVTLALARCPSFWLVRPLSVKFWRNVGRRSYTIYLVHFPLGLILIQAVGEDAGPNRQLAAALSYFPLLIGITELLHRYVEKPAMRLRRSRPALTDQVGVATPKAAPTGE